MIIYILVFTIILWVLDQIQKLINSENYNFFLLLMDAHKQVTKLRLWFRYIIVVNNHSLLIKALFFKKELIWIKYYFSTDLLKLNTNVIPSDFFFFQKIILKLKINNSEKQYRHVLNFKLKFFFIVFFI